MRKRRSQAGKNPGRINDRIAVIFGGTLVICFVLGSGYLLVTGRSEPHLTARKTTGEISEISINEIEQARDSMDSDEKQKVKDMLSKEQIEQIKQQLSGR